jgi:hypothetical protein
MTDLPECSAASEPVGWRWRIKGDNRWTLLDHYPEGAMNDRSECEPLYRAVPQTAVWQPIETAPKDGSPIDLLFPYPRGRTIDCMWRQGGVDGDGHWVWLKPIWGSQPGLGIDWHLLPESGWEVCSYPNMEPTHWMPACSLPRPQPRPEGGQ